MSERREDRVRRLFDEAQDRPASERESFLRDQCGEDEALLDELLGLLGAQVGSQFLEPPLFLTNVEELIGRKLGDFTLKRIVGAGGMGVVFEAEQAGLERRVAVKVVHPHRLADGEVLARFLRESRLTAGLQHPGIVQVLATGQQGGLSWYAMELVRGLSLAELMALRAAGDPKPGYAPDLDDPRAVARIGVTVLEALQHAHESGVIHRDVKPGNILLDRSGRVLLGDFGLAHDASAEASKATRSGLVAGTLAYMSPEQARQLKGTDRRTDIYSAAAVFYELLTGSPPYGEHPSAEALIATDAPEVAPLRAQVGRAEQSLALCVERALRRDPERRYDSAERFARDLESWLRGEPVQAKAVSLGERFAERWRSRRFVVRFTAGVVAATLIGSALTWRLVDQVQARSSWAKLRLAAADLPGEQRLGYTRFGPEPGSVIEARNLRAWSGRETSLSLPPGRVRVRIETTEGLSLEFDRLLVEREELVLRPALPPPLPDDIRWLSYETSRITQPIPFEGTQAVDFEVDVPGFSLSAAPITNRHVEAYLQASGRTLETFGQPVYQTARATRASDDWLDLPAVALDAAEATAVAEWWGCRLPTSLEWSVALGQARSKDSDASVSPDLVPMGDPWIRLPDDSRSSLHAYALYVQPAAPLVAGAGFELAGVVEWTSSPMIRLQGERLVFDSGSLITRGLPWHNTEASEPWRRLEIPRRTLYTDRSAEIGFRFARTPTEL